MLIGVSSAVVYFNGVALSLWHGDITHISILIYACFVFFTVRTGVMTYRLCSGSRTVTESFRGARMSWFASDAFLTAGMIGTVLGFIYLLGAFFGGIDVTQPNSMQEALCRMSGGMCTALYTTAMGLICGLLLKIQLFNLEYGQDEEEEGIL